MAGKNHTDLSEIRIETITPAEKIGNRIHSKASLEIIAMPSCTLFFSILLVHEMLGYPLLSNTFKGNDTHHDKQYSAFQRQTKIY